VRRLGERPVALVHEGHDLVTQVAPVSAGARRVDELAAAERRPGVDERHDARRGGRVEELEEARPERGPVAPHVELAGQALDDVDGCVPAVGLVVVAGRDPDPERPSVRVAERVAAEEVALDDVLVEAAE